MFIQQVTTWPAAKDTASALKKGFINTLFRVTNSKSMNVLSETERKCTLYIRLLGKYNLSPRVQV